MTVQKIFLLWAALACGVAVAEAKVADDDAAEMDVSAEVTETEVDEHGGAEENAMATPSGSIYIPMKPAFVVNYGGPGRLKYIKADISVRLHDSQAASSVRHHMPYIRNNLVMLFASQTDESISSQEGKDALRKEALQEVRNVLQQEDQQEGVVDLYFNSFLIQQ